MRVLTVTLWAIKTLSIIILNSMTMNNTGNRSHSVLTPSVKTCKIGLDGLHPSGVLLFF